MSSFMRPEIVLDTWYRCRNDWDEEYWTPDLTFAGDEDRVLEEFRGWGARLSAAGYLDATDWEVFDSEDKARADLADKYGLCEQCLEEWDECVCQRDAGQALREVVDG